MEEPIDLRGAPGEDPLKWLKEYDRVANFNKWDDMMCLANVYFFLDGTARQWVLAPVSTKPTETRPRPTYAAVTRKYRAPVQKFPPEPRKTDVWRTADNRPVCFHCGRPGHVMRYCRERLSLTTLETADGTSTTLALKKYADQTLLAVLRQVPRGRSQYVVTDPRRHIADPVSRQAVGARKTKESDLPRRISNPRRHKCSSRRQQTFALREKYCYTVHGIPHIVTEKVMSGLPTCSSKPNHPRGMCIGQAEPLNEGHLCVISDTSGLLG
ncbi:CCHC-type domain-containing protein [Trichonephila clavipes]|nr:CCHC-type domain-containing protein [Trichonephila clavipes]